MIPSIAGVASCISSYLGALLMMAGHDYGLDLVEAEARIREHAAEKNWVVVDSGLEQSRGPLPVWLPVHWGTDLALESAELHFQSPGNGTTAAQGVPAISASLWWRRLSGQFAITA